MKARLIDMIRALRCIGSNIASRLARVRAPSESVMALDNMKMIGIMVKPITQMIYGMERRRDLLRFIVFPGSGYVLVEYLLVLS